MSKKFFSLIYGEKNQISANDHIIPANAVGKLLDAEEVLNKVHADAERYKQEVAEECEKLKELAQIEGFAKGYEKWTEHIALLNNEIHKVRQDLEKSLVSVALKASKKILGRELELSKDAIVDIVSNILKSVSQHKKVTIYVNKKDLNALENGRPRLREVFENIEVLSLRENSDITPGGCIIETEGGIINAKLENQWNALEKAFSSLMQSKKPDDTLKDEPKKMGVKSP